MNPASAALTAVFAAQLSVSLPAQAEECCAVIELRQYITYPGKRDDLITLFEREFIESQEAVGIHVLGQFRDVNDPHRFTWVRGFSAMPARKQALTDFYFGPLWKTWKSQANATLYDNETTCCCCGRPRRVRGLRLIRRAGRARTRPRRRLASW